MIKPPAFRQLMPFILFTFVYLAVASNASSQGPRKNKLMKTSSRINLHYETYGSGPPILLVHGFGASTYSWRNLISPLSVDHKLILVDLKGFGKSPKPIDDSYRAEDQADLVFQF